MTAPANTAGRADRRSTYEDIDKSAAIVTMLEGIADARTPIIVRTLPSGASYSSAIVSVDGDRRTFVIDEVLPLDANRHFTAGMRLRITTQVREVDASFTTVVLEANRRNGGLHELQVPSTVRRYQKRSYFRAKCSGAAQVHLVPVEGEVIQAELRDLSIGGVGLRLRDPVPAAISLGAVFHDCEILLGPETVLSCMLEIRHVSTPRRSRMTMVGCRFLDLDKTAQNTISRVVARWELEQLTRRK
jgi:flagellar brake protein